MSVKINFIDTDLKPTINGFENYLKDTGNVKNFSKKGEELVHEYFREYLKKANIPGLLNAFDNKDYNKICIQINKNKAPIQIDECEKEFYESYNNDVDAKKFVYSLYKASLCLLVEHNNIDEEYKKFVERIEDMPIELFGALASTFCDSFSRDFNVYLNALNETSKIWHKCEGEDEE